MPNLRYMGTSSVDMVKTKDDGKFEKVERVNPRDEISVSDEVAKAFLRGPRFLRVWVEVGSEEDPESNSYQPSRYDQVTGNATPYPELDMGSTVQPRRVIFRTEEDNEEGFDVAGPDEGPRSDNAAAIAEEEVQMAARKAADDARKGQATQKPAMKPSAQNTKAPEPQGSRNES